jgi:hypothetical protein
MTSAVGANEKEMKPMFELTTGADLLGLEKFQSVVPEDLAQLWRCRHGRFVRIRKNVCLVTANGSLNGIGILNILNGFGAF